MDYEQLKLDNQLCFPLYAASRLMIRAYQPFMEKLGITYPQYLVLMVLWEHKELTVSKISSKLFLKTNTLTPLLKRMEKQGIVKRTRSSEDERIVKIRLSDKGIKYRLEAEDIPLRLGELLTDDSQSIDDLIRLKNSLHNLITKLEAE
jgi:DNA-binding MarR family transcriptional regulator